MTDAVDHAQLSNIRKERDLYLRLLNLGGQRELAPFLREALALIVEVVEARQGYLELHNDDERTGEPRWWIAHGFSVEEISGVRATISRGIVAEAIATGQTIVTPSAFLDPRFSGRESVRLGKIEAVMCAPIGEDPPRGVLYLQGRAMPGLISEADRARAELFANHLTTLVERLLAQQRSQDRSDATQVWRQKLRVEGLIGRSPALAAALKEVALVAPLEVSVLLTGESGTGKSH